MVGGCLSNTGLLRTPLPNLLVIELGADPTVELIFIGRFDPPLKAVVLSPQACDGLPMELLFVPVALP